MINPSIIYPKIIKHSKSCLWVQPGSCSLVQYQPYYREIFLIVLKSTCFNNPSIPSSSQYIPEMMQVTSVPLPCRQYPLAEFLPQFTINKYFSINQNSIFLTTPLINLPHQLSSTILMSTCLMKSLYQPSSAIHQSSFLNDPSIKVLR